MPSRIAIYALLAATALALLFCTRELPTPDAPLPYRNMAEGVEHVGMETCRSCHGNIHKTFIHTGMGRSFGRATREKSDASFGEHALVYDEASNLYYKPLFRDSQMYVLEYRLQDGDTLHQRLETIDYIVGSGQHTNSHIIDINGYIYQAPITYYTQDGKWDMAPGFRGDNIRFSRLLAAECITCHNHYPEQADGSLNRFTQMPSGIECERCHGPGEIHVKEKLAGNIVDTAKQIDYSIVNPRDLPRDLQMDLCQRCHLQGIAVLKEGKSFFDFRPGQPLRDVMNVFLPRFTNSHDRFIMASQADRLRLSPCYQASDMSCITCHNPHQSVEATGQERYNKACLGCHGGVAKREAACAAPLAERQAMDDDCAGCHMPKSGSIDIPHVRITDHFISRRNTKGSRRKGAASEGPPKFLGLKILTKDKGSPLEMAKGYLALYDKYTPSQMVLDSALMYLNRSEASPARQLPVRIHHRFAAGEYSQLLQLAKGLRADTLSDAWMAYRVGEAYAKSGKPAAAVPFFRRATELMPQHPDFREKWGSSLVQLRRLGPAVEQLKEVLQQHPKRPMALNNLGYARLLQGKTEEAESLYDQAIALDPDYEQALLNKAALRLLLKDEAEGRALLRRVLQLNPDNRQARQVLQRLR